MAAGMIILPQYMPARDRSGRLVSGARLTVYVNRTTTKATVYADAALTTPVANPVIANSSGQFASIWAEAGTVDEPSLYTLAVSGASGESIGNPAVFNDWQPSLDIPTLDTALGAKADSDLANVNLEDFSEKRVSVPSRPTAISLTERFGFDINVMDFIPGVLHQAIKAGSSTDDVTTYIQAAYDLAKVIGRARVYWPAGNYRLNDAIEITSWYTTTEGAGYRATRVDCWSTTGDGFFAHPAWPDVEIFGITFGAMSIYRWGDSSGGAGIHLERVNDFVLADDLHILGHYGGVDVVSSRVGSIGCQIQSDQHFASRKIGSYLLRFRQKPGSSVLPAEIFCVGNNLRGNTDNKRLDYAVLIQACDGIWLTSGHYGFCYSAGIALAPETPTSQVTAVNVSAAYLDQVTACGLRAEEPAGYSGVFGAHQIDIAQIHDCNSAGVYWNCLTSDPCSIRVGQALKMDNHAVHIVKGDDVDVRLENAYDINQSGGNGTGVLLQGGGSGYNIYAAVRKSPGSLYTPFAGIRIEGSVNNAVLSGKFTDCTNDILKPSTGVNIRFGDIISNRSRNRLANNEGALDPGFGQDFIRCTGVASPAAGIGAISGFADGRTLTILFSASVNVFDVPANGLNLDGTFSATAGSILQMISDGSAWYEISRKTN